MSLNSQAALAIDPVFRNQIRAAAIGYAVTALSAEPTVNQRADKKKWNLAVSTIADGCVANLDRFAWTLASVPGFQAVANDTENTNDGAIASAMVSQWSKFAGVTAEDLGA